MTDKKAILVIGAGDATGGAIARRFAREGYIACVTRRDADKLDRIDISWATEHWAMEQAFINRNPFAEKAHG